jgi:hypothetical protein
VTIGGEPYTHGNSLIANKKCPSGSGRLEHRACVAIAGKKAKGRTKLISRLDAVHCCLGHRP